MGRKILDIYTEYKIPPNLQRHMLWVAAVATMIYDNFEEPLSKEDVVTACLLHDMGNIVKYDMDYFPQFHEPEGKEYWQNVQNEFKNKYGKKEHEATRAIAKNIGLPKNIVDMVGKFDFFLHCIHLEGNDMGLKIMNYSDNRVNPFGIVSYDERMEEARKRYQNREDNNIDEEKRQKFVACGKDIEKQIFAKCKIKPEDINDETVKPIVESLKNFVIE
jgi:hypothetical protein